MEQYSPSIMQYDVSYCYLCGKSTGKLDRHEPIGGPFRQKSKKYGMWCSLCHETCHLYGVHKNQALNYNLKRAAQKAAMQVYGWSKSDFIREFGKNYL